jgi:hypothetical protein
MTTTASVASPSKAPVPVWLRVRRLAELEGVTTATIQTRCRAGAYGGAQKRGKYWYIPASALAVEGKREPTNAGPGKKDRSPALGPRMSYQEARAFLGRP